MKINNFPKYYLADVPQALRRQLLDMCYAQQRPAALELLRQHGFHQYDDVDLQAFYSYAPTNLPEPPESGSGVPPLVSGPAEADPVTSASSEAPPAPIGPVPSPDHALAQLSDNPIPLPVPEPPTPEPAATNAAAPEAVDDSVPPGLATPPPDIPVKRRGKVARLPREIRNEVNLFLDDGKTLEEIAQWLDEKGFPGFNVVNLHNWKDGGFQEWLREQERLENQQLQREWIADLARQSAPGEMNQLSLQLFSCQIMNTLFGMDTTDLKKGLGSNPRHYIALLNSVCRMHEHFMDSEEYQAFIRHYRERKNRKRAGLTDETCEMMLDRLGIVLRQRASEPPATADAANLKSGTEF
jgi:hypothetical protein